MGDLVRPFANLGWVRPPWLWFPSEGIASPTEAQAIARELNRQLTRYNKGLELEARSRLIYKRPQFAQGVCGPQLGYFKRVFLLFEGNDLSLPLLFVNPVLLVHPEFKVDALVDTPIGQVSLRVYPWVTIGRTNGHKRTFGEKVPGRRALGLEMAALVQFFLQLMKGKENGK